MQKGGTGKTTTTLNLGAALVELGKTVLLVDFDPQASLTTCVGYGRKSDEFEVTINQVLVAEINERPSPAIKDAIVTTSLGFDLVPADLSLSVAEFSLFNAMSRESILKSVLTPIINDYDFIIIDCTPSLGLLTTNALVAANRVIIPVSADFLAMKGLQLILGSIVKVKRKLHAGLEIEGILLTLIERTVHNRSVVDSIRKELEGKVHVFEAEVSKTVKVKESASASESILSYAPDHEVAAAYRQLAQEVESHG